MIDDSRQADRSVRLREVRKKRRKVIYVVALVVAVIALGIFSWYTHHSDRRITAVTVEGAYLSNQMEVQRFAEEVLNDSTLVLFSNRYPWLVPLSKVQNAVEMMPSVAAAEIRVADNNTLHIKLTERNPIAIACSLDCKLIDERGTFIGTVDKATTTLITITVQENEKLINANTVGALVSLLRNLEGIGLSYNRAAIIDEDQSVLEGLSVPDLKVAFKTMDGAVNRIKTAMDAGMLPTNYTEVAYIDARFESQVSYLPKENSEPVESDPIAE